MDLEIARLKQGCLSVLAVCKKTALHGQHMVSHIQDIWRTELERMPMGSQLWQASDRQVLTIKTQLYSLQSQSSNQGSSTEWDAAIISLGKFIFTTSILQHYMWSTAHRFYSVCNRAISQALSSQINNFFFCVDIMKCFW